jgi:curved DNA-binding protein CbpA
MDAKSFVNYYEILEIAPTASSKAIERSFRYLALRYHPDNQATGDRVRFDAVLEAHATLKDAAKRAEYHKDYPHHLPPLPQLTAEGGGDDEAENNSKHADEDRFDDSLGIDRDVLIQNNLLILLYLRRRGNMKEPGIGNAELERLSGCPHEHLEFHIWYLKEKGWIATREDGLLAITIDGVERAAVIYRESIKMRLTDQR